jgi:hypothetical protein
MVNDDSRRGGTHLDARLCERLIDMACSDEKTSAAGPQSGAVQLAANGDANVVRTRRDSLRDSMIGLILGPDSF